MRRRLLVASGSILAALVALAIVVVPSQFRDEGKDSGRTSAPASSPSPSKSANVVPKKPAVDLAALEQFHFPEEADWQRATGEPDDFRRDVLPSGQWLPPCSQVSSGVGIVTVRFAPMGDEHIRQFAVYADEAAARAVVSELRSASHCTLYGGGMSDFEHSDESTSIHKWVTQDVGDSGFVSWSEIEYAGEVESSAGYLVVASRGPAVYLGSLRGEEIYPESADDKALAELTAAARRTMPLIDTLLKSKPAS